MNRLRALWQGVRQSFWLLPTLLTIFGATLALALVRLDRVLLQDTAVRDLPWFLFEGGVEGARGVLGTIAGSIITVTGVVFSITIVALQLASTQFTPRVLRSYTEDRANQTVLGIFMGTFTYSLLVLRTVRSEIADFERFVPAISVTIGVLLTLLSIGSLIFFVNHIARSIQAEVIVDRVTRDALRAVDRLFPEQFGKPAPESATRVAAPPDGEPAPLAARKGGYIQAIFEDEMLRIAEREDLTIRMERRIGEFVLPAETVVGVWPAAKAERVASAVLDAIAIGPERTQFQDVERGLIELTDIGVRALSPGVNDPTTAIACVDRVSEVLSALGRREFPRRERVASDGRIRFIARRPTFDEIVRLVYSQLRHHGGRDPAVARRLLEVLGRVAQQVPPERRPALATEIEEVRDVARRTLHSESDLARIEEAARAALLSAADRTRHHL